MDVASNLKSIRTLRRYTQEDIAEVLNITQQQYSRYEVGVHDIPIRYAIILCKFYGISADWLLGLKETME